MSEARGSSAGRLNVIAVGKHHLFWEARNRIFVWYVALLTFFVVLSIPLIYQVVTWQVNQRVRENLSDEIEAFTNFAQENAAEDDIEQLFDSFLSSRVTEDDNVLITFVERRLYRSSVRLSGDIQNRELLERWSQLSTTERGEWETGNANIGRLIYIAEPVVIGGQQGAMVAVHATAGELQEVQASLNAVVAILLVVVAIAVLMAWFASKNVLLPLRTLLQTIRRISEKELTQRIVVQGQGEMAELASTFNSMMERLQAAFEEQRNFVNDAGHELRTPITIIRGHLELLDGDPEEQQKTVDLVLDELDRMSRFVDDLILLAKAEQTNFLYLETVAVETLTEELYAKARAIAPRRWQLVNKGTGTIVVDRQRITQAVMNLAENATQHTTETDAIVIGSAVGKDVRFWIEDSGTGIKLSDQQHIFKRFARAANSRRPSEGAGLGLSIVEAIAQAHGGRMKLYSQPGVGSTFTLILPLPVNNG